MSVATMGTPWCARASGLELEVVCAEVGVLYSWAMGCSVYGGGGGGGAQAPYFEAQGPKNKQKSPQ